MGGVPRAQRCANLGAGQSGRTGAAGVHHGRPDLLSGPAPSPDLLPGRPGGSVERVIVRGILVRGIFIGGIGSDHRQPGPVAGVRALGQFGDRELDEHVLPGLSVPGQRRPVRRLHLGP